MWIVTFCGAFYKNLTDFLFSTAPDENGCFLLANSYKAKEKSVLLVTGKIQPAGDSWNYRGRHFLEPSSSYVSRCAAVADSVESSLLFVHTHPNPRHPSAFSAIDKKSNEKMFANLASIISDRPLGSLVFGRNGICGAVFDKGRIQDVHKIKIVGSTVTELSGVGFEKKQNGKMGTRYDRQIRAFGRQTQSKLQDITATIVGVGGTGASVAVQLARMGVQNLQLIDMDRIDETNLHRVYGSDDSCIGKSKVEVLDRHIRSFSRSKVNTICGDVTKKEILGQLVGSDVIFACTDNLTSRSILNDISNRYYIPLIDVGCRIRLNNDGSISQAAGKVQVVMPDSACLWCSGTLDGKLILQESLSEKARTKLVDEGYYDKTEKQPSIISLTTMAASMAVTKLLNIFGVFGDQYNPRTQIELHDGFMIDDRPEIKANCICRKNLGKGTITR